MTGVEQEAWLQRGLDRSHATWNVLAQQVMFTKWDLGRPVGLGVPVFNMDAWDGYVAARQRLLDFLVDRAPANPIVLTGDIHSAWAADILERFDDPGAGVVAAEFVARRSPPISRRRSFRPCRRRCPTTPTSGTSKGRTTATCVSM